MRQPTAPRGPCFSGRRDISGRRIVVSRISRRAVGEGVELCVELVDALHVGCEPLVVECSVMGEREGGAAEVGEGEVELVPELGIGVGGLGVGGVRSGGGGAGRWRVRVGGGTRRGRGLSVLAGEFVAAGGRVDRACCRAEGGMNVAFSVLSDLAVRGWRWCWACCSVVASERMGGSAVGALSSR